MQRHQAQERLGVRAPRGAQHGFGQASMERLQLERSSRAAAPGRQPAGRQTSPAAEGSPGPTAASGVSGANRASGASGAVASGDSPGRLSEANPEAGPEAGPEVGSPQRLSSSRSMDLLAQIVPVGDLSSRKKPPRSMLLRGMEGLCLPRYPVLEHIEHPLLASIEHRAST